MTNSVPHLEPHCPWYHLSEMALPNVKWCEATRCSWITEPSNTWSNLAYIIVAIYIFVRFRKLFPRLSRLFLIVGVTLGLFSGIYHASYTFFFQVFDFIGMYMVSCLLIVLNQHRSNEEHGFGRLVLNYVVYILLSTMLTLVFYYTGLPFQVIFFFHLCYVAYQEWQIRKVEGSIQYKFFFSAIASLTIGLVFSALDVKRIVCFPNSIYQGHAVWHLLAALSIYLVFLFFSQFKRFSSDSYLK